MFVVALPLIAHPAALPRAVAGVTCSLSWQDAGNWVVSFIVAAPPSAMALPAPCAPARVDGLWQHSCFELFLSNTDDGSYCEFNFSPSGEWAAYAFDSYRSGMRPLAVRDPWITSSVPDQFACAMAARLAAIGLDTAPIDTLMSDPLSDMPNAAEQYTLNGHLEDATLDSGRRWILGMSAVIEEVDGTKSFWALAHPPGKPDFHHPDCFTLKVPAPSAP